VSPDHRCSTSWPADRCAGPAEFSARLPHRRLTPPFFGEDTSLPICSRLQGVLSRRYVLAFLRRRRRFHSRIDGRALVYPRLLFLSDSRPVHQARLVRPFLPAEDRCESISCRHVVAFAEMMNLTKLLPDAQLNWSVPQGSLDGSCDLPHVDWPKPRRPSPNPGRRARVDKFDAGAMDAHSTPISTRC